MLLYDYCKGLLFNVNMKKLYNILISILAIASIVIVILDLCNVISIVQQPFNIIDTLILLIFTFDYAIRFFIAKDRKKFFKENIFDLIAIIPFNSFFSAFRAFRLFRMLKLTKIARFTRVIRAAAFLGVLRHKLSGILKTNGFIYVLYANIALISISSIVIMFAENQSFGDALWWSIVTCTTVGYGDISPSTTIGRIVAIILMVFGIGLIGMLTGAITTYFTSKQPIESTEKCDELNDIFDNLNDEQKKQLIEIAKIISKK